MVTLLPVADQAERKKSDQIASHQLQHADYLKEDIVRGIVLVGVQRIIKRWRTLQQEEEAVKFRRSDFGDPATIHEQDMPGLTDLKAGAAKIDVAYTALANGGQIRYTTTNPALIMALHH